MLNRPLWVDELHSSWVVSASWPELGDRARAGNQSSLYFVFLKLWVELFGQDEWSLRLPSLMAWIVSLLSMARWLMRSHEDKGPAVYLPIVCWCLAIFWDRMQVFYAVEARSYALVQLLNLWAWMQIAQIVQMRDIRLRPWIGWATCASLMIHLHITSGLSLAVQSVVLLFTVWKRKQVSIAILICFGFVIANGAWQLAASRATWHRRQQWASFAGNESWEALLNLFPTFQIALPTSLCFVAWLVWIRFRGKRQANEHTTNVKTRLNTTPVWLFAAIGPAVLAWSLTCFQIAPLMHYRFVIVAALPLYLSFAELGLLITGWLRAVAVLATLGWMLFSQGLLEQPLEQWRAQRQENWRDASHFIAQRFSADTQTLWCYSGLIEAVNVQLPLSDPLSEYLSYPLRGIHQIKNQDRPITPHALIAERKSWLQQIQQQTKIDGHNQVWIVYRGPAERLERDLRASGLSSFKLVQEIESFDRVSVVCLDTGSQRK